MWTALLIASMLGRAASPAGAADDRAVLKSLAETADTNRAKFVSGRIWFEMQDGSAKNVDEAARGELTNVYTAEGFYAFRDANAIYRSVFPDEAMIATTTKVSETRTSSRLQSGRYLTDGKVTLDDSLSVGSDGTILRPNMIRSGSDSFYQMTNVIPLALGFPEKSRHDFGWSARRILEGASGMTLGKVEGNVTFEGVQAVKVEVKGPGSTSTIWVDPARGAIPIRTHDEMPGGNTFDVHNGDIRLIPGFGWLPFEQTAFFGGRFVRRLRVTKVDFGKVPEDTFRLEFPKPVAMFNTDKNLSYAAHKVWDLARLPSANASGTKRFAPSPAVDAPVMPGEREAPPPYGTYAAVGLLIVAAVVGLWAWRAKRTSTK